MKKIALAEISKAGGGQWACLLAACIRMNSSAQELPRLLHVGEVNVEETFHGSLLLFRLFSGYDPSQITIVENARIPSEEGRRVPGVKYHHSPLVLHRLFHNRWSKHFALMLALLAKMEAVALRRLLAGIPFDAISTVVHGWSWLGAMTVAAEKQVPLHLVLHDDWPSHTAQSRVQQAFLRRILHQGYRRAATRFCVSPGMELAYRQATGCAGEVLYPARSASLGVVAEPSSHLARECMPLRVAYAGTINAEGYPELIAQAAHALADMGGRMILYTPQNAAALERQGLNLPGIEARPAVPSPVLVETLRNEADVLFLPMSHHRRWRENMALAFPSKLADYTAAGLPILIAAPEYSSAAQWTKENPGAALLVTSPETSAIKNALQKIAADPALRMTLARGAIDAGNKCFTAARAHETFVSGIARLAPARLNAVNAHA